MARIFRILGLIAGIGIALFVALGLLSGGPRPQLAIVSGSENKALAPIIQDWARAEGVDVSITYQGSVDIARALEAGRDIPFDAVWPANSLWIALGDAQRVVKHDKSIFRSPVVLGLKKSIAERLGWIGRDDITIQDIQSAARDGEFRLAMTSATQSNSGASAYFGFLYALAGDPDLLTMAHLSDEAVLGRVRDLLAQVDRSSGSSGWLASSLVESPASYDAMFNYEALIIEANQELDEPLYAIYPANGLAVADSPLGYVDKGDAAREAAFLALQAHLMSADVQQELVRLGRRAGLIGLAPEAAGGAWNPAWGVDPARAIAPLPTPEAAVIEEALSLYQTELRKPSLTVWVLDVSGSMEGAPLAELKSAMGLLLDPEAAALNLLQPSRRDVTIVIPFNNAPAAPITVVGNAPEALRALLTEVRALEAGGGTDLYQALALAFAEIGAYHEDGTLQDYLPAMVAMTDGASDDINRDAFLSALSDSPIGRDIPIHAIAFGAADEAQLAELNEQTLGRLFTAGDDLAAALRKAKGYN